MANTQTSDYSHRPVFGKSPSHRPRPAKLADKRQEVLDLDLYAEKKPVTRDAALIPGTIWRALDSAVNSVQALRLGNEILRRTYGGRFDAKVYGPDAESKEPRYSLSCQCGAVIKDSKTASASCPQCGNPEMTRRDRRYPHPEWCVMPSEIEGCEIIRGTPSGFEKAKAELRDCAGLETMRRFGTTFVRLREDVLLKAEPVKIRENGSRPKPEESNIPTDAPVASKSSEETAKISTSVLNEINELQTPTAEPGGNQPEPIPPIPPQPQHVEVTSSSHEAHVITFCQPLRSIRLRAVSEEKIEILHPAYDGTIAEVWWPRPVRVERVEKVSAPVEAAKPADAEFSLEELTRRLNQNSAKRFGKNVPDGLAKSCYELVRSESAWSMLEKQLEASKGQRTPLRQWGRWLSGMAKEAAAAAIEQENMKPVETRMERIERLVREDQERRRQQKQ